MDQNCTTVEKRTTEVIDISVDWVDEMGQEPALVSAVWSVDPDLVGDAGLADGVYKPRVVGTITTARVLAGNTQDTMFVCTAMFTSGQVLVDKTLIKWVP